MSHEFEIDPAAGLVTEAFTGTMSEALLREADKPILTHPDFRPGLDFLTDLRAAEIAFGYDGMQSALRGKAPLQIRRQAFVVTAPGVYGMVRMYISLTENDGDFAEARIFPTPEEARQWLTS